MKNSKYNTYTWQCNNRSGLHISTQRLCHSTCLKWCHDSFNPNNGVVEVFLALPKLYYICSIGYIGCVSYVRLIGLKSQAI